MTENNDKGQKNNLGRDTNKPTDIINSGYIFDFE